MDLKSVCSLLAFPVFQLCLLSTVTADLTTNAPPTTTIETAATTINAITTNLTNQRTESLTTEAAGISGPPTTEYTTTQRTDDATTSDTTTAIGTTTETTTIVGIIATTDSKTTVTRIAETPTTTTNAATARITETVETMVAATDSETAYTTTTNEQLFSTAITETDVNVQETSSIIASTYVVTAIKEETDLTVSSSIATDDIRTTRPLTTDAMIEGTTESTSIPDVSTVVSAIGVSTSPDEIVTSFATMITTEEEEDEKDVVTMTTLPTDSDEVTLIYTTDILETATSNDRQKTTDLDEITPTFTTGISETTSLTDVGKTMDSDEITSIITTHILETVSLGGVEITTDSDEVTTDVAKTQAASSEATDVITVDVTDFIVVTVSQVSSESTTNSTQPPPVNTTAEMLTSLETEQNISSIETMALLPDIIDGDQGPLKLPTPSPAVETTSLQTETEFATERQEYATTPPVVDSTDFVTEIETDTPESPFQTVLLDFATVAETDIVTEIQTSKAGIIPEELESTTVMTSTVTSLVTEMIPASQDISDAVLTDSVLTTGATNSTEVVTETEPLALTTEDLVTTVMLETVKVTNMDMTTVVELESTAPTDLATTFPVVEVVEQTTTVLETTEVLTTETVEFTTQAELIPEITTRNITTEQIQTTSAPTTPTLPIQPISNASQHIELMETTSLPPVPTTRLSTASVTTKRKVTASSMDSSDMTKEEVDNSITMEFTGITREKWMSDMDQTFRELIANLPSVQGNPEDIVYISPTPMVRDEVLYVTFIVVSSEGSSRRRRESEGSLISGDSIMEDLNNLNMTAFAASLGIPEDSMTISQGLAPGIPTPKMEGPDTSESGKADKEKHTVFATPGLFIALIIIGSISVVVITVGFIYLVCDRRRSTRGEYVTNSINKDLDLGIDNPAMLQDKTISNGNGAHLINIKVIDGEQDIVPYDSFTQEEIMNCEVEDTHL